MRIRTTALTAAFSAGLSLVPLTNAFATSATTVTTTAKVYYVSDCGGGAASGCQPGSDSNDGLSPARPWKTVAKFMAAFNNLNAGDSILLARGGVFTKTADFRLFNPGCLASKPCTLADYTPTWAPSGVGQPILRAPVVNALDFENGGNAVQDGGYVVKNLHLSGVGGANVGVFLYNDVDDVTLDNLTIEGLRIGVQSAGANTAASGAHRSNDRLTLRNSLVTNNSGWGFLGSGNNLIIEGNRFINNGFAQAILNHNVYIGESTEGLVYSGTTVRNNELYQSAMVNGKCSGVSLVVHGRQDNLTISDNYVHEDVGATTGNCWGIAVDNGYATAEGFNNVVITRNKVSNLQNIGIGVTACNHCTIDGNSVTVTGAKGVIGIAVPSKTRKAIDLGLSNVSIVKNSIYLTNTDTASVGVRLAPEGSGYVLDSNVVGFYGAAGTCVYLPLGASSIQGVSSSKCYVAP